MKKYSREKYKGIYGSWYAMKQRCGNPNNQAYHNYGGRGITYPKAWESFEGFKADMGNGYKAGLTLDRINVNGNYCIENCRWITQKEQTNNMRKNVFIKFQGQNKTLSQWADYLGLRLVVIKSRYYRGMSLNQVFQKQLFRPRTLNP